MSMEVTGGSGGVESSGGAESQSQVQSPAGTTETTTPDSGMQQDESKLTPRERIEKALGEKTKTKLRKGPSEANQVTLDPAVHTAAPKYEPNFKYKAYDEEKEIPEAFRSLITTKEMEDQVRALFEKSDGLDGLKPRYQDLKGRYEETERRLQDLEPKHQKVVEGIQKLHHAAEKDLHRFFELSGISEDRLIKHVSEILNLQDDPVRWQQHKQARELASREAQLQEQLASQQAQYGDLARQHHDMQLRSVLSMPQVQDFQKQFDERLGEGAFLQHVRSFGSQKFYETKQNISPVEAVQYVLNTYSSLLGVSQQQQVTQQQAAAGTVPTQPQRETPPTLPNLGQGRSVAPAKPRFKDLNQFKSWVKEQIQD